jgi:hypothetical protein
LELAIFTQKSQELERHKQLKKLRDELGATELNKHSSQTDKQTKEVILETVKKQKPETTNQLIKLIQEKTQMTEQEIIKLLIELENEDKLQLTHKKNSLYTTPKAYIHSKDATWFWITIATSIATAIAVFTIPENAYPLVYLRSALGVVFVLFLPGYTFIKTLFPSKLPIPTSSENMDTIERATLSFGMSLALVPIVGLILNYTPWGIRLTPVTLSLLALTVAFATAAILREYQAKTTKTK